MAPDPMLVRQATAALIPALGLIYIAVRGAGYDTVVRQEFGLAVWVLLGFGMLVGAFPRTRLKPLAGAVLCGFLALALFTALALAWTGSDERTYAELARVLIYLGVLALAALALDRHTWRFAAGGIAAAAVFICALAVASRLAPETLSDNDVARATGTDRLSYPLDYWNAIAAWGAMTAAIGLAWSSNARSGWQRAVALGCVPLACSTVYLSYSRTGVIGISVGLVVVIALSRNRWTAAIHALAATGATALVIGAIRSQPAIANATGGEGAGSVAFALLFAIGAAAVVAVATGAMGVDRLRLSYARARVLTPIAIVLALLITAGVAGGRIDRAWEEFRTQSTAAPSDDPAARLVNAGGSREDVWNKAIDAFWSDPLEGIGPGTFEYWWAQNGDSGEFVRDAHSLYLEQMGEGGIVGFLILVGALGGGVGLALTACNRVESPGEKAAATAMCSAMIVFLVHAGVDWMWEETAVSVLGLGAMGVMLAAYTRGGRRHRRPPSMVRAALTAIALLAVIVQIPVLVSTARTREAADALAERNFGDAVSVATRAIDAEPWAAGGYAQRAAAYYGQGKLKKARSDLQSARSREPINWRYPVSLAQVQARLGDDSAAMRSFGRAQELNPQTIPFRSLAELSVETSRGCLAYPGFSGCEPGQSIVDRSACEQISEAAGDLLVNASRIAGAASPDVPRGSAVRTDSPVGTVYYVAAPVGTSQGLWVAGGEAYRTGSGLISPLNAAARASTPPPPGARIRGFSRRDDGAQVARACVKPQ